MDNALTVNGKFGVVYDNLFYPANYTAKRIAKLIAPFYEDFDMDNWEACKGLWI